MHNSSGSLSLKQLGLFYALFFLKNHITFISFLVRFEDQIIINTGKFKYQSSVENETVNIPSPKLRQCR